LEENRISIGEEMKLTNNRIIITLATLLVCFCGTLSAQTTRENLTENGCNQASALSGVYRIDVDGSDKLYSVIESAASNVPYSEQQQFLWIWLFD
jgi:ABC-type phosphate transport system substrate-binding protein